MVLNKYNVTVRTLDTRHEYTAIAMCGADAASAAYDKFGVCSVTVRAA
jgi:thiamine pyrophosphate-dependent acetolactate synthase large subunit-like protein